MFPQLLPQPIDNRYHGHKLALGCLALLVLMKVSMGLNCILNGRQVASSADGIPLDTLGALGAQAVVALFALWGLSQLIFGLLGLLVLLRYRSAVPLMLGLLLVEQLSRKLILHFLPIAKSGTPPSSLINLVFLTIMVAGLVLSLWSQDRPQTQE